MKWLQAAPVQICMAAERTTKLPRAHKASQKLPLSAEAQRISRVLENHIDQVEIALSLPAFLSSNIVPSDDKEFKNALRKHQLLEERAQKLEGLKQESDEEVEARAQLGKDIKNSFRDLLRLFRAHPSAISDLRAVVSLDEERSEYKLLRGLKTFHSNIVDDLLTSPEEELQLNQRMFASPSPTDQLKELDSMEEAASTSIKQCDTKILQKQMEINNLQHSLQENSPQVNMPLPTEKQSPPHIKTSKKQEKLQQEIDQLTIQLNSLMSENRQAERILQEENAKVETAIEHLLQNFDRTMEEKQAILEQNETDYEREKEELKNLEKCSSVLKVEYEQILERRRLAEEKRMVEMRELELKTKAAIFAQAWWRGYSVRKALKNKDKNKKAIKGKGRKK
uniref:Dynein regulatory complex protein 10 n=1 Tax=Monopterus albus TaxID=43700 RepID=A0A3Q3JEF7_MONAL